MEDRILELKRRRRGASATALLLLLLLGVSMTLIGQELWSWGADSFGKFLLLIVFLGHIVAVSATIEWWQFTLRYAPPRYLFDRSHHGLEGGDGSSSGITRR